MKVWQLKSSLNDFETLGYTDFDRESKLSDLLIRATPLVDKWGSVEVCTIDKGKDSDCPHFWDCPIPVLSEKAFLIMRDFFRGKAEALLFHHPEKNFFAIHVLNVIDAIDYDQAVIEQLDTGLRVGFEKYAFIKEKVVGQHIFRIYLDDRIQWRVFVSDEFKKTIESNGLVGFQFIEVWDSEF